MLCLAGAAVLLLVAGCAPGPNPLVNQAKESGDPAGFFLGLWHGVIVWFTFVWSLFNPSVSIYEVHNNGWPYNLGFLLGAGGLVGGGAKLVFGGDDKERE